MTQQNGFDNGARFRLGPCRAAAMLFACFLTLSMITAEDTPKKPAKTKKVQANTLALEIPKTWTQEPASNRFRAAQFKIPPAKGDSEQPELVVYYFGKQSGGGVQANINRWVGQFAPSGRNVKVFEGKSSSGKYSLVDVSGTYNKPIGPPVLGKTKRMAGARMLAAIVETKEGSYFLKFTGLAKSVTASAAPFRAAFGADAKDEKEVKPEKK